MSMNRFGKIIASGTLVLSLCGCGKPIQKMEYNEGYPYNMGTQYIDRRPSGKIITYDDYRSDGNLDLVTEIDNKSGHREDTVISGSEDEAIESNYRAANYALEHQDDIDIIYVWCESRNGRFLQGEFERVVRAYEKQ